MKPYRIQLSRAKGFSLQETSRIINGLPAVNCSRPGRWGNPFRVNKPTDDPIDMLDAQHGVCFSREAAVKRFKRMLRAGVTPPFALANIRKELRGKNLACWCPFGEPCHADVLLEVANK